jgi:hypothetical protein
MSFYTKMQVITLSLAFCTVRLVFFREMITPVIEETVCGVLR